MSGRMIPIEVRIALPILAMVMTAQAQSPPVPNGATGEAQMACGVAAKTDYIKADLALRKQETPIMSVEGAIAQRRLEEQYCFRLTRCFLSDEPSQQFRVAFHSCISDPDLEKQDAVPRE
jgi:hypothetical protein